MSRRARRLLIAAAAVVVVMTIVGLFVPSPSEPQASSRPGDVGRRPPGAFPEPAGRGADGGAEVDARETESGALTYAIDVEELAGLSLDTPPGSSLQLWVMWKPPVVKHPRLQKLLDEVILDEILPPLTTNDPYVAVFSVTRRQAMDLMYANHFGELSVTRPIAE